MESFDVFRGRFAILYAAVKEKHGTSPRQHRGHGLDHDAAVAQMAVLVAPTLRLADMGWVAAIIHSTDRLVEKEVYPAQLREYLSLVPQNFFTDEEIEEIFLAVLEHDEKSPLHRSSTQEVLQDADKLVNMQSSVLIRSGQFQAHIPAIELAHMGKVNPASTYHKPKSVLDSIRILMSEYPELLFTKKGKELVSLYEKRLRNYEQHIIEDYQLLGLIGVEL